MQKKDEPYVSYQSRRNTYFILSCNPNKAGLFESKKTNLILN